MGHNTALQVGNNRTQELVTIQLSSYRTPHQHPHSLGHHIRDTRRGLAHPLSCTKGSLSLSPKQE